jgi:hypothetical protein
MSNSSSHGDAFTFLTQMEDNETEMLNNKEIVHETIISLGLLSELFVSHTESTYGMYQQFDVS